MENNKSRKDEFEYIYENNVWGGDETTKNGPGSSKKKTVINKKSLAKIFELFTKKKKILSDIGSGDLAWMKQFISQNEDNIKNYIGYDIATNITEHNKNTIKSDNIEIINKDCVEYIPKYSDVILCRQVLGHLYTDDVKKLISNVVKSGSIYFITSQDFSVKENKELKKNRDKTRARGINLLLSPFNFPEPIMYIDDFVDFFKLGVWKISDLKNIF